MKRATEATSSPPTARRAPAKLPARGPGRPARAAQGLLNRGSIIGEALELARDVPLHELSIVRVAEALNVTPGLIHYYLGGRDALTSGVINAFYKQLLEGMPTLTRAWRADLEATCKAVYNAHARYPGIASYLVSHNRFRLVQAVQPGETDYGLVLFENFMSVVRAAGFDAKRTGTYGHLLNEFITGYAQATAAHRWPGEHAGFLDAKFAQLDKNAFPAVHFISKTFTQLDAVSAFETGLTLFLNGLALERKRYRATSAALTGVKK